MATKSTTISLLLHGSLAEKSEYADLCKNVQHDVLQVTSEVSLEGAGAAYRFDALVVDGSDLTAPEVEDRVRELLTLWEIPLLVILREGATPGHEGLGWFINIPKFPTEDLCHEIRKAVEADRTARILQQSVRSGKIDAVHLSAVIANSPHLILVVDRDFRVLAFNAAQEREIFRMFSTRLTVGADITDIMGYTEADKAGTREFWSQALAGNTFTSQYEFGDEQRYRRTYRVSCYPLLDTHGGVLGAVCDADDITEEVATKKALQESERRLKEAQHLGKIGSWEWFIKEDKLVWSDELFKIFGLDPNEPIPSFEERVRYYTPESLERLRSVVWTAVATAEPYEAKLEAFHRNGEPICLLTKGEAVKSETGEVVRIRGVVLDITEQEKKREEERVKRESYAQTQKLESLGLMAGSIAHDFNNRLMAIIGNTEIAMEDTMDHDPRLENLQAIMTECNRATELCRQLLAYTGRGITAPRIISVNQVLHNTESLIKMAIGRQISLDIQTPGKLPHVLMDSSHLQQVIMNLAMNAGEAYGEDSGFVSIRTSSGVYTEDELKSTLSGLNPPAGEYVTITIQDNGVGMPEHVMKKAFAPFFSTKFVGRGLGLAAVVGHLKSCGGSIQIESNSGEGTQVTVYIPVTEKTIDKDKAQRPADRKSGMNILVADDESTIRHIIRRSLAPAGYTVYEAEDGQDAIEVFDNMGETFKAVVIDIMMPKLTGDKVYEYIRHAKPDLPIIVMSGYSNIDMRERFGSEDSVVFLQKPFTRAQLLQAIQAVLGDVPRDARRISTPR